ncbi:MAG: methyltransferase domain-containing protein [Oligoflexales bacterium]
MRLLKKFLLSIGLASTFSPVLSASDSYPPSQSFDSSEFDQSDSAEIWKELTPESWRNAVYHKGSFFEGLTNEYQEMLGDLERIYRQGRKLVLIELGCGTGDFLFNAKDKADFAIGVDFNKDFLEYAEGIRDENELEHIQFVFGDANNLQKILIDNAPAWIWGDDVLRVVACVGNTFGVIPQEFKKNCIEQMLLTAGEEGFLFIGYWNGKAFPRAVKEFYKKNTRLCGDIWDENVSLESATLTSQTGYSTRWMFSDEVKNEIKVNNFEILNYKDQGVGVSYVAKVHHEHTTIARNYYDSEDAYNFYKQVWGGENIHIGEYDLKNKSESTSEKVREASKKSLKHLGEQAGLSSGQVVVDLGSAYGGAVRYLTEIYDVKSVGIDISHKECQRAKQINKQLQLNEDRVLIKECSFANTGLTDNSVDVVVSHDSLLHAGSEREAVIAEVSRILKPGGKFVFLDPMQTDDVNPENMQAVYQRIQLRDMASPSLYKKLASNNGLKFVSFEDRIHYMRQHYKTVAEVLSNKQHVLENVSEEYIDNMSKGLQVWVDAIDNDLLAYGTFVFQKI